MWPFRPKLALHFPATSNARQLFKDIDKQLRYVNKLAVEINMLKVPEPLKTRSDEYVVSLLKAYVQMNEGLLPRIEKYRKKVLIDIFEPVEQEKLDKLAERICNQHHLDITKVLPTIRYNEEIHHEFVQWWHLTEQADWINELQTIFDPNGADLMKAVASMPDTGLPTSFYKHTKSE